MWITSPPLVGGHYGAVMRWDNLFDDLEGQLEHELDAEQSEVRAEEERLRLGRLSLRDRLMALANAQPRGAVYVIGVILTTGESLGITPSTFGKDWVSATVVDGTSRGVQCVLPLSSIAALILTGRQVNESLHAAAATQPDGRLVDRIGVPFVLRDLCRRRRSLDVQTRSGITHGTIDRVGRDHFDLAVHESGAPRRERDVVQIRVIPLDQVVLIRLF